MDAPDSRLDPAPLWLHVVRDSVYEEVGRATLQSSGGPVAEGTVLVAYRGEDARLWARPEGEFCDGRFMRVARAPVATQGTVEFQALDHFGRLLDALSDLHPDQRWTALDKALAFQQAQRPLDRIGPSGHTTTYLVHRGPMHDAAGMAHPDTADLHAWDRMALDLPDECGFLPVSPDTVIVSCPGRHPRDASWTGLRLREAVLNDDASLHVPWSGPDCAEAAGPAETWVLRPRRVDFGFVRCSNGLWGLVRTRVAAARP